ncbi:MAG: rubrerythrin [Candidatus Firestonebacteria bacterium RIFOXYC2_FULL_39_67]|nr:MAG: rubrerythrin [Candidatus Firestonebacteria bacterium RIFOXYD2_FULL_39_29]OGF52625.1 MAG: rubrerythrin [Candidatus Firestonebacteria bacterium RifOxyC12_full_39_7]OGF53964.1 MAG: rubrerythrin [Candidatus Firestonebacteria bacterium RIFOXYC2_FULL_39_67]
MASVKGTETEKNLLASFAGESQARNRYTYFASVAKKEGFEQIAWYFSDTADNEKEHAKRFFKFLEGGDLQITATYPAGIIGTTKENLKASAAGEKHEYTVLYPEAAKIAEKEGFKEVAALFRAVSKAEMLHEGRYNKLMANLEKGSVFKKSGTVKWKCRNCGYMHEGPEALEQCPACLHPKAYFELFCENY